MSLGIEYDSETNRIKISNLVLKQTGNPDEWFIDYSPEQFLDALDDCLLLKIKQLKLRKITKMTEYIKRHEKLADEARDATTRLELAKLNTEKLVLKEIRHAVKLMEMEEKAIKTEKLERQMGEVKQ